MAQPRFHTKYWIFVLLGIGSLVLHILFAWHQPFTNDEGAYLYDAKVLLSGNLPAGDVLTKTPISVFVFAVGECISRYSLFAARGMAVLVSMATAVPLFFIARSIATQRAGYYAVLFWLLGPGPIIFNTFGHTEVVASFVSACSLAFLLIGIQKKRTVVHYLVWSGVCFAFAFATRKTAIVLVAPYIVSLFLYRGREVSVKSVLRSWILGAGGVYCLWLIAIGVAYGTGGVWQMIGGGYGDIIVQRAFHPHTIASWGGSSERFFLTIIRAGTVYGIGLGAFLGVVGTAISVRAGRAYGRIVWGVVALIACGISVIAFHDSVALGTLWVGAAGYFLRAAFRFPDISINVSSYAVPASHVVSLALLYACWPVLLAEYLGDFLAPVTILCAIVAASYASNVRGRVMIIGIFLFCSVVSMQYVYKHPWTGMFLRDAVYSAAHVITQEVPLNDSIFTGAVIILYVSGHSAPFHIAHPQWYRYDFISQQEKDVFLPPLNKLHDEVQKAVHWKIGEQLTDYAYGSDTDGNWVLGHTIPNNTIYRDNPIRIYSKVADDGKSR